MYIPATSSFVGMRLLREQVYNAVAGSELGGRC